MTPRLRAWVVGGVRSCPTPDVTSLRGLMIIPGAPVRSSVHRNARALVAADENDLGVSRNDPDALVLVATRPPAPAYPDPAAIRGLPANHARGINYTRMLRI